MIFGRDFGAPAQLERLKRNSVEMLLRFVAKDEAPAER
jgi:hypothetical protein